MSTFETSHLQANKMDSKEGLEALFEFATEGIMVADHTGTIIKTNPATEKMFGYEKGELLGKKVEVLIPNRYSHVHVGHREKYSAHPHARSMGAAMDLKAKRKDGSEFPVEISLSPFSASDGDFVIAFIIDITIRKKAEEAVIYQKRELEMLNADLEKRVKERTMILEEAISELNHTKEELHHALLKEKELNDLKSRFVSMASHEFRTPLATILSSLSLATKYSEKGDKENQAKHISRIKTSIGNLTDILNDFLSISKLEEGKISTSFEKLNIRDYVTEILKEIQPIAKENQEIIYSHTGNPEATSDKKFLKHILFNLLTNAIKFSPEGKPIELKTDINKSQFILSIKDSGMGISEADQKHLFERFFRAHNATNIQGTGLGLNIVAKYVEMLEGTIDFKSALEQGTTFTIKLPIKK